MQDGEVSGNNGRDLGYARRVLLSSHAAIDGDVAGVRKMQGHWKDPALHQALLELLKHHMRGSRFQTHDCSSRNFDVVDAPHDTLAMFQVRGVKGNALGDGRCCANKTIRPCPRVLNEDRHWHVLSGVRW